MADPTSDNPKVSIVVATYARLRQLQGCVAAIRANVSARYELIVVGGGAGDGTEDWMATQSDIRFIRERRREGACRAYNKGLRAARGLYCMWLNDDARPHPGAVEAALAMIERPDLFDVGMVAFYHNFDRQRNRLDSVTFNGETYSIYNVRGVPYANFGLLRRDLLVRLGFLDERYYFCAWDPDLSLKVQREAGLKVLGCRAALIDHDELIDERKQYDLGVWDADNEKLFAKWRLPDKFAYPDPVPAYQETLKKRQLV